MKKRILSLALALCCLVTAVPILALPATAAEAEDTWTPTFRYVLLSDEHVNAWWDATNSKFTLTGKRDRMVAVMKAAYAMAEKDGLAISALISGGDQVSAAMPMEYTELVGAFTDIQNLNSDELPIYAIMGNHEYNNGYYAKNDSVSKTYKYEDYFTEGMSAEEKLAALRKAFIDGVGSAIDNTSVNWTATIEGYAFIGLSIDDYDGHLSEESLNWLDDALYEATTADSSRPVFLTCHMAVKDTVTYSDVSSCYVPESEAFQAVLAKYPSVILSTGHTHKSAIRPSAAWQADDGFAAVSMPSLTEQAEFYMVEVDANNTVRYIPYYISGTTATQLTDPTGKALYYEFAYGEDGKPTAQQYTATAQAAKKPAFATGATLALSNLTAIGTVALGDLRIPQALAGDTPADAYDITIQEDGASTSQTVRLSATDDVWKSKPASHVGRSLSLKQGATYTITVTPVSLFGTSGQALTLTDVQTPTLVETKDPFFYTSSINWGSKSDANYPTFDATAGTVTFKNGWEMGVWKDGTIKLLDKCLKDTAFNSSYADMWSGHGGMHHAQNVAGYAKPAAGGLLWQGCRAPYTGYFDLTISDMKMASGESSMPVTDTSKTWYAVANLTTGEILWPAAAAGRQLDVSDYTGWAALEGTATIPEATASGLRATAGDVIGVVVALESGSQWGVSSLAMTAHYTHLIRSESVLHKDTFVQKAGAEGFPQVPQPTEDGQATSGTPVYSGAFTIGPYHKTSGYLPFTTACSNGPGSDKYFYSSDMWGTGGLFAVSKPGASKTTDAPFVLGSQAGYSTALVWTASRDGIVTVDLSGMKAQVTGQAYTIVRNFADGLLTGAFSGSFAADEWIVCDADVANSTSLKGIQVKKGDTIALLLSRGTSGNGWGMYDTTFSVSYTGYVQESTAAADVIPGAYKAAATSKELDLGNSGWDVVAYASAAGIAGQKPYLLNTYSSAELYQNSTLGNKVFVSANGNQLNYWGKSGALAIASGYVAGYRYTAKKSGTVAISLTELSLAARRGDYIDPTNIGYAIYKNGVKVFPEGETAWYTVEYTTADNRGKDLSSTLNASLPRDLAVSAGDRIEVLATNQSEGQTGWNGAANVFFPCISYLNYTVVDHTAEKEFLPLLDGRVTVPEDGAWTAVSYTDKANIGTSSVQLIHTNGDNGSGGLNGFYTPGGAYAGNSKVLLVPSSLTNTYWAGGSTGALLIASGTTAGYRYTAEQSGTVDLRLGTLRAVTRGGGAAPTYPITMEYAIYVNGQKIWPAAEGEWYSITYTADSIGTDYAAALNTFLPTDLYLAQGDRVEVLSHTVTTGIGNPHTALATLFLPEVRYHSVAQVSVLLGGELALNIQPASDAETITATWNGETVALTRDASGRYTLGGILPSAMGAPITLTWNVADTTYNGVTIPHTAFTKELTFAACLMQYVQTYRTATDAYGKAVYELAVATLNYGAAAQTRFGDDPADLPNKDLTEEEKNFSLADSAIVTTASQTAKTEGMTHKFAGVSLLLRDTVQLKLYVTGENGTSARIKYWTSDESQAQYCDLQARNSTDPNAWKATIAVLPSAYAETYHFQIVDAAGNAVGTTLTYSVAAYADRVPSESTITARLITMGLAAEAYLAAQNA